MSWLEDRWHDLEHTVNNWLPHENVYAVGVINTALTPYDNNVVPTVLKFSLVNTASNYTSSIAQQVRHDMLSGTTNKMQKLTKKAKEDNNSSFTAITGYGQRLVEIYVRDNLPEIINPRTFQYVRKDSYYVDIPIEFILITNHDKFKYDHINRTMDIWSYTDSQYIPSVHQFKLAPTEAGMTTTLDDPISINIESITHHTYGEDTEDSLYIPSLILVSGSDSTGTHYYSVFSSTAWVHRPVAGSDEEDNDSDIMLVDNGHGFKEWNSPANLTFFYGDLNGEETMFVHKAHVGIYKYSATNGLELYHSVTDIYESLYFDLVASPVRTNHFNTYPIIPIMINNDSISEMLADENHPKHSVAVKAKETMQMLEQDIEQFYDDVMGIPSDATQQEHDDAILAHGNTTDMYLNFSLDLKRKEPAMVRATYDYFKYIHSYLNRHSSQTEYWDVTSDYYSLMYTNSEIEFDTTIEFSHIFFDRIEGVYTYTNDYGDTWKTFKVGEVVSNLELYATTDDGNGNITEYYAYTIYRQFDGYFIKLGVPHIRQVTYVDDGAGHTGKAIIELHDIIDSDYTIALPMFMEISKHIGFFDRVDTFPLLFNLQTQAVEIVHLKWWQTKTFVTIVKVVVVVIMVVLAVVSDGAFVELETAIYNLVINFMIGYAVNIAIKQILLHIHNKYLRLVLLAIVVIASAYVAGDFNIESITDMTLSDSILVASTVLNKYVTMESQMSLAKSMKESEDFDLVYKKAMKELEQFKFEKFGSILPEFVRDIRYEMPEQFRARTSISDFPSLIQQSTYYIQDVSLLQNIGYN